MAEIISFHSTEDSVIDHKNTFFQEVSQLFLSIDKFTKYSIYTLLVFFLVATIGINLPSFIMQDRYTTNVTASPSNNLSNQTTELINLTNQYVQANEKTKEDLYIKLAVVALERKLTLQSILRDNPQQVTDTLLSTTIVEQIPASLVTNVERQTNIEGIVLLLDSETNDESNKYILRTPNRDMNLIFITNTPQLTSGSTIRVTGYILDTDIIIKNGLASTQTL